MRVALTLAAAAAVTGVLVAAAAPASADSDALRTITHWEQQGYTVNIDRVGSGPLDKCIVTSVRNPNTISQLIRENSRGPGPSFLVPVIISRTVQVSLYCAS